MGDDQRGERGGSEEVTSKEEQKKLFREMEEDYAARREENRREREGVSTTGPRETWPSEIAEANRRKQPGQDQCKSDGQEHILGHDDGHSM
jgi:hypothetical protein